MADSRRIEVPLRQDWESIVLSLPSKGRMFLEMDTEGKALAKSIAAYQQQRAMLVTAIKRAHLGE